MFKRSEKTSHFWLVSSRETGLRSYLAAIEDSENSQHFQTVLPFQLVRKNM